MKILSLNVWVGGKLRDVLAPFIHRMSATCDVLCFQETHESFFELINPLLTDFECIRSEKRHGGDRFDLVTLVRKNITVVKSGTVLEGVPNVGFGLWVIVAFEGSSYYVCNYHGKAQPGAKLDTSERLVASRSLIAHAKDWGGPAVILGDFNLLETTESVRLFETGGFANLIKEYDIFTTRNEHSWNLYPETKQLHSDYAFVSNNLSVAQFNVLDDIVPDHQPLFVEVV